MNRLVLPFLFLAVEAPAQTWTQLTPPPYTSTSQRRAGGIAFDPIQGKLLMYGGLQSNPSLVLGDTWTFDGATWTQLASTGPAPRLRSPCPAWSRRRWPTTAAAAWW